LNDLQIFSNPAFGDIRTIEENGNVLFCAYDVAYALGYSVPRKAVYDHCKGVLKRNAPTAGGLQELSFLSEPDVYRLISKSQLPSAEKFEAWIFEEVLPSIRKHGAYMTPAAIEKVLLNPDTIIQLATQLKDEQEKRKAAESKIEADKPKVLFADSVAGSRTSILIRDLAKMISQNGHEIGEKRLFQWLRENGYLISKSGRDYNSPTQRSMELGVMEVKETSISHTSSTQTAITPLITGKGQRYFITKILNRS
jgi:anti-repressor protein